MRNLIRRIKVGGWFVLKWGTTHEITVMKQVGKRWEYCDLYIRYLAESHVRTATLKNIYQQGDVENGAEYYVFWSYGFSYPAKEVAAQP